MIRDASAIYITAPHILTTNNSEENLHNKKVKKIPKNAQSNPILPFSMNHKIVSQGNFGLAISNRDENHVFHYLLRFLLFGLNKRCLTKFFLYLW